jgi:APA family basic amino acid/polyamine antiporter
MRKNGDQLYHTFGYPFIPIFFIVIEGCMMVYVFANKPIQSLTGLGITLAGLIIYLLILKPNQK